MTSVFVAMQFLKKGKKKKKKENLHVNFRRAVRPPPLLVCGRLRPAVENLPPKKKACFPVKATGSRDPLQRAFIPAECAHIHVNVPQLGSQLHNKGDGGAAAPTSSPRENAFIPGIKLHRPPSSQESREWEAPEELRGSNPPLLFPWALPSSPCIIARPAQCCPAQWPAPCPSSQLPLCKHMNLPLTHYRVTLSLLTPTTKHVTQDAPRLEELCGAAVTGATQGGPLLDAGAQGSSGYHSGRRPRRTGAALIFSLPLACIATANAHPIDDWEGYQSPHKI